MDWQLVVDIASIIGNAATAIGVFFAASTIRQAAKNNKDQANMQVFLQYTERFERVMSRFPKGRLEERFDLDAPPPEASPELTLTVLLYLNLVSEEYYLLDAGYLDQKLWDIWQQEIERTLTSPLFQREWQLLKREFSSFRNFQDYVDNLQQTSKLLSSLL